MAATCIAFLISAFAMLHAAEPAAPAATPPTAAADETTPRVSGTDLVNPDFAELGRVLGCHGETVARTDELAPALDRAITANRPAIIELRTDPNLVTTRTTISALREAALARARENA